MLGIRVADPVGWTEHSEAHTLARAGTLRLAHPTSSPLINHAATRCMAPAA